VSKHTVIVIVLLVVLFSAMLQGANPTVSVAPDSTRIDRDSVVVVQLPVSANSTHLKAISLTISFDPNVIRTDSASVFEGTLLASAGKPTFFWRSFSPDSGVLSIDVAILGDGTSISGAGNLATIRFRPVGDGASNILIAPLRARDENNVALIYDELNGWARVCQFRGDVNADNTIDISDVVYIIAWIFSGGPTPIPVAPAGDVNCDDFTDISDAVYLIQWIFAGGPAPCGPCFP
jgi:hypothetical protein